MNLNYYLLLILFPLLSLSQPTIDEAIEKYNSKSVDYIRVSELVQLKNSNQSIKLLDAREASEYSISHLQNAMFAGYEDFSLKSIQDQLNTQDTIVVYCSIGVRSEQIGEKLQKAGYKHIFNLYGGIFEWVNSGQTVYDQHNKPTNRIHAYDRFWGRYLEKGEKVY
ncbi:rhodanese-like domain-containing protein [Psychroflexus montanilacus]|uniref:rhodanese-like domain-containing protein n=1 Tax=Psychroflexus montanilacus TaxID=2873598 RepID=UPI001CC8F469|nr:rhodanese-like domain-containing protein [Psychroflexus montanilacus]MBZ9652309.1 rhodanese-like domain-containing protein [Psychroflexus montanilacus]